MIDYSKLPLSITSFSEFAADSMIYVDKTDLVANLEMGEPLYTATIIQTAMNVAGVENVKLIEPTTDTVPEENEILQPDSVEVTVL